jgi:hypothetical protein
MTEHTVEDGLLKFSHEFSNGETVFFHLAVDPNLTPEQQIESFVAQEQAFISQVEEWQSQ